MVYISSVFYCYLLCICGVLLTRSAAQRLPIDKNVVIAPDFDIPIQPVNPITPDTSVNNTSKRHIFQPQVLYRNDIEVLVGWMYDISLYSSRTPNQFIVEMAAGPYSEDFLEVSRIDIDLSQVKLANSIIEQDYLVENLQPVTSYRLRVVPLYSNGPGVVSEPVTFITLRAPINYWEPIIPRRSSRTSFRRGFSDPVEDRPHLSPGVEIFQNDTKEEEHQYWQSDAPTRETPVLPSGRRGHTMTFSDGFVYMFGGRTNGK